MHKLLVGVFVGLLVAPSFSFAALGPDVGNYSAEEAAEFNSLSREEQDKLLGASMPAGTVNCFDYYHFGSVAVSLNTMSYPFSAGQLIPFVGEIANENDYPVVDVKVYAKIFRVQETTTNEQILNGDFLIDQLMASERIDLGAQEHKPFQFVWQAPSTMAPGEYRIAFYVVAADKFNLAGLSFTDDVDGDSHGFTVESKTDMPVEWNKNGILVNDDPYYFAKPIPKFNAGETVTIKAPLENPTSKSVEATVTWSTYSWDAQSNENLVKTERTTVTLPPKGTKTVMYTPPSIEKPVTYVTGMVDAGGARSIIDVRFAHLGGIQARINFPALTKFPLAKGESAKMFSCLHAVNPGGVENGTLTLSLLDDEGVELAKSVYSGKITGEMMGYVDDFTISKGLKKATLRAELAYEGNTEVVEMMYDCDKIAGDACANFSENAPVQEEEKQIGDKHSARFLFVLPLLILIVLGIMFYIMKKKQGIPPVPPAALVIVLTCAGLLGMVPRAEAASVSWTNSSPYNPPCQISPGGTTNSTNCITNAYVTVTYTANSSKSSGSLVKTGDIITITTPYSDTDIDWFGTGTYTDSPYGNWNTWDEACLTPSNWLGELGMYTELYGQVNIVRPAPTISASGMSCTGTGPFTCTVTSTGGSISATVTFPSTSGEIRQEIFVTGTSNNPPPPYGIQKTKGNFLTLVERIIAYFVPRAYAVMPVPPDNVCQVGTPQSFTVGQRQITHTFTVDNNALMPNLTTIGGVSPTNVMVGANTLYAGIVTNSGGVTTGTGFYSFIRAASGANGSGVVTDLGATPVPALAPGQSAGVSAPYIFNSPGTYSLQACADMFFSSGGGTIVEANEGDNCGPWTNVVVNPAPSVDLLFR